MKWFASMVVVPAISCCCCCGWFGDSCPSGSTAKENSTKSGNYAQFCKDDDGNFRGWFETYPSLENRAWGDLTFGIIGGDLLRKVWYDTEGKSHGWDYAWHPNGRKLHEIKWNHGKKISEKQWHPSGYKKLVVPYNDNGQKHGQYKSYYEDGTLKKERKYLNGAIVKETCYSAKGKKTLCGR